MARVAPPSDVDHEIRTVLARANVRGCLHARPVDDGADEVAVDADAACPTASTYKIAVLLEVACRAAEGGLALTDRVHVPPSRRTTGTTGICTMLDAVDLSVRDLAMLMIQVSDNTATDVLQELVGTERVRSRLAGLGLANTAIRTDCQHLLDELLGELGGERYAAGRPAGQHAALVARSGALRAETGNTTTPRDMTTLLSLIWRDEAGPVESCAEVRRVLGCQHAPHRLSTAYRDGPLIAGKTGTLYGGARAEVGVVDFGGGDRYAVAVYLQSDDFDYRNATADAAVGRAAGVAIDHLRRGAGQR
jgi:beta-lactamase class A